MFSLKVRWALSHPVKWLYAQWLFLKWRPEKPYSLPYPRMTREEMADRLQESGCSPVAHMLPGDTVTIDLPDAHETYLIV